LLFGVIAAHAAKLSMMGLVSYVMYVVLYRTHCTGTSMSMYSFIACRRPVQYNQVQVAQHEATALLFDSSCSLFD